MMTKFTRFTSRKDGTLVITVECDTLLQCAAELFGAGQPGFGDKVAVALTGHYDVEIGEVVLDFADLTRDPVTVAEGFPLKPGCDIRVMHSWIRARKPSSMTCAYGCRRILDIRPRELKGDRFALTVQLGRDLCKKVM